MSALQKHLDNLTAHLAAWSKEPLVWSRVLIAEDTNYELRGAVRISWSAFHTPEEYAAQFDGYLDAGYPWINMNAGGILNETLLVFIELPSYRGTVPRERVSVNFSGPNIVGGQTRWDASGHIEIVD